MPVKTKMIFYWFAYHEGLWRRCWMRRMASVPVHQFWGEVRGWDGMSLNGLVTKTTTFPFPREITLTECQSLRFCLSKLALMLPSKFYCLNLIRINNKFFYSLSDVEDIQRLSLVGSQKLRKTKGKSYGSYRGNIWKILLIQKYYK